MVIMIFVGIAPNMMLAKVCSDMNKPNGQYLVPSTVEDVMSFIRKLPIRKVNIALMSSYCLFLLCPSTFNHFHFL